MGSFCTVNTEPLPDPKKVITGTDIPEWVSAAGQQLYEQSAEIASQDFPGYTGPRIATFGEDNSKLTADEQAGQEILRGGTETFQSYLDDSKAMADTLGGGFTSADTDALVGESFAFDDFDTARSGQYQDIFQTSIDPAIEELNRQRDLRQSQNAADAIRAGAFGGSRLGLREATTDAEIARAGSDLRRQAGRDALQFASQRYDTDRAFDASRFDADRAARFAGEDARRGAFETDEASRLRATETLQSFAPLAQGLTEQAAAGLLTSGGMTRDLDQRGLDLAYGDYLEQRQYPQQQLNFALGALQGVPYETRTIGLEQGQQFAQTPSIYGQTISGLGSLASAYYLGRK
jgi:hypothetical protein